MGQSDRWSTPKQIKIERAGEPRGTKRGKLKKGERKKGKKARIDEILAEKKRAEYYKTWFHKDKQCRIDHPEWYSPLPEGYPARRSNPDYKKWFDEHAVKLERLIARAVQDGVISQDEVSGYIVAL